MKEGSPTGFNLISGLLHESNCVSLSLRSKMENSMLSPKEGSTSGNSNSFFASKGRKSLFMLMGELLCGGVVFLERSERFCSLQEEMYRGNGAQFLVGPDSALWAF